MSRIIEIVLFLTPFVGLAVWRLLFPSPLPPSWLVYGLAGLVVVMLVALFWLRQLDAEDGAETYVPARMQDGHVVSGYAAEPR